jgi:hypothetical protein
MVFLTLSQKVNQFLGPAMLRNGLRARYALGRGVVHDNPTLDNFLLIPLAQKLISLESREEMQQATLLGKVAPSWLERIFSRNSQDEEEDATPLVDAEIRVKVLERYLRPVLCRNNRWSEVRRWQFHPRFLKWARAEYLLARHGDHLQAVMGAFPSLQKTLQLQVRQRSFQKLLSGKLTMDSDQEVVDPSTLPKSSLLTKVLEMESWTGQKDTSATSARMKQIAERVGGQVLELRGGGLRFATVSQEADLSALSLQEILELAGGHVANCGPFNTLCEEADIYQLWTEEYVEGLGSYLRKRTEQYHGDTLVLDVGAGDGLLAKYLRDYFEKEFTSRKTPARQRKVVPRPRRGLPSPKTPTIIATDDGSWRVSEKAPVERMSVEETLDKLIQSDKAQQVIVLCSWMPLSEDWTTLFRSRNVDEYILIGEYDEGQCGDNWETWGNPRFRSSIDEEWEGLVQQDEIENEQFQIRPADTPKAPHQADGYKRHELRSLRPYQFSRFDCSVSKAGGTISFRRT